MERELTHSAAARERLAALQAELDVLRPQLIDAEALLAELLAAISAFEFTLRARLGRLSRRLDDIQREINDLRTQMRRRQAGWLDVADGPSGRMKDDQWRYQEEGAAASGSYRYRAAEAPTAALAEDQQAALKLLYRQLARRFHPDLAQDEADRDYRTRLMMAINAAYSAGDLAQLERLALEPDSVSVIQQTDEALIAALEREIERCRRRLDEIQQELQTLERHPNARLMRRVEKATAEGHDLLADMAANLRRQINEKMVERDVLQTQLEEMDEDEDEFDEDDEQLADVVFNLGLEQAEDDEFISLFDDWSQKQRRRWADEIDSHADDADAPDDHY